MVSQGEKLACSVREMAQLLGIGMNSAYAICHRQDFKAAIWLTPKKCIISVEALAEWMRQEGGKGIE